MPRYLPALAVRAVPMCAMASMYLQARYEVRSLQKSQLADLVHNRGDLGVGGSGLCRVVPSGHVVLEDGPRGPDGGASTELTGAALRGVSARERHLVCVRL